MPAAVSTIYSRVYRISSPEIHFIHIIPILDDGGGGDDSKMIFVMAHDFHEIFLYFSVNTTSENVRTRDEIHCA